MNKIIVFTYEGREVLIRIEAISHVVPIQTMYPNMEHGSIIYLYTVSEKLCPDEASFWGDSKVIKKSDYVLVDQSGSEIARAIESAGGVC